MLGDKGHLNYIELLVTLRKIYTEIIVLVVVNRKTCVEEETMTMASLTC